MVVIKMIMMMHAVAIGKNEKYYIEMEKNKIYFLLNDFYFGLKTLLCFIVFFGTNLYQRTHEKKNYSYYSFH